MRGENDSKFFEVSLQTFHLATSNDGEHIRRLLHDVRNRDRGDVLRTDFFGDLLKCGTNDPFFLVSLPLWVESRTAIFARLKALLPGWMLPSALDINLG